MQDFETVLDELERAARDRDRVSVADIRARLGEHAFGPVLLTLGIIALSPIGDIPGAPTVLSVFILLVAGQLAMGRKAFWLPPVLLRRSLRARHVETSVRLSRRASHLLGRVIWRRLTGLTRGPFAQTIGAVCVLLAVLLPPLEVVPFGTTVPSTAITLFGLSLVSRDGLLAALATLVTGAGVYLVVTALF